MKAPRGVNVQDKFNPFRILRILQPKRNQTQEDLQLPISSVRPNQTPSSTIKKAKHETKTKSKRTKSSVPTTLASCTDISFLFLFLFTSPSSPVFLKQNEARPLLSIPHPRTSSLFPFHQQPTYQTNKTNKHNTPPPLYKPGKIKTRNNKTQQLYAQSNKAKFPPVKRCKNDAGKTKAKLRFFPP